MELMTVITCLAFGIACAAWRYAHTCSKDLALLQERLRSMEQQR